MKLLDLKATLPEACKPKRTDSSKLRPCAIALAMLGRPGVLLSVWNASAERGKLMHIYTFQTILDGAA